MFSRSVEEEGTARISSNQKPRQTDGLGVSPGAILAIMHGL